MFVRLHKFGNILQNKVRQFVKILSLLQVLEPAITGPIPGICI